MKGYIVYSTYKVINDETIIQLYGRLENGQSFVAQNKIEPYFFIEKRHLKKVKNLLNKFKKEETKLTNFEGESVIKISSNTQTELNKLHQAIHKKTPTYEADIRPHYRFMIDNNLLGTINIEGDYETAEKVDRFYNNSEISQSEYNPRLKVAAIDIETDKHSNKLFCIGIYSEEFKKVLMITENDIPNLIKCKTEEECLQKFKSEIQKIDPDIITGWNFIDFDLVFLKKLFEKQKIPFDLGRNNDSIKLRIEKGFFRSSSADIPGRQILDGLPLIRDPFIKEAPTIKHAEFESFTLEDVAQEILGAGKLIKGKGRNDQIEKLYKTNSKKSHQELADYNLKDCELAFRIIEKTKILDLAIERSQLTGLPLDRLTASIAAFDSLYLRKARTKGLVCPTTKFGNKEERITGGYVSSANPGIYHNVLILDFKSLYPSIIKTFNIDPASYLEKKEKNAIESPNKAYFKNQDGILPEIIERLHQAREKAKQEKRELASYAIKIIQNSFFGVLANPNCRFFNLKMANAITHFGQFIIKLTAKEIEKMGYKVIYSDTDSVFVETGLSKAEANQLGRKIEEEINSFYKNYTKKNYNRTSFLELQFEKQYLSMMLPKLRGQEAAAKKRYAGLLEKDGEEQVEIVGLEAIRGDWTEAAQEFQRELLLKIFKKEDPIQFIKSYIKKIKDGKMDNKLIYKKSIRKSLSEYIKTTPPHVKAARQLDKLESNMIQYYQTTNGPEPIQKLKHKIDYEHYIKKQIEPIANQVLTLLDKDFDSIIQNSKQATLF